MTHKALTVRQPWAWAIVAGWKRIENRVRLTTYRGPLLIHASQTREWLDSGMEVLRDIAGKIGFTPPRPEDLVFGEILGRVLVVDCFRDGERVLDPLDQLFAHGPFCLQLARAQQLVTPIPCRGQQWMFNVPYSLLAGAQWLTPPVTRQPEAPARD